MRSHEALIHVDFSENYVCKFAGSVSSAHYGASQHQVTLHTGIYYIGKDGAAVSFCGVSDFLAHGPGAIWTFLRPVLTKIENENPDVSVLYFYSDGPTAQYRQKGNFYQFSSITKCNNIKFSTWNFTEAGHCGKGAPDGIGAVLKRTADQIVSQGRDIPNASAFCKT